MYGVNNTAIEKFFGDAVLKKAFKLALPEIISLMHETHKSEEARNWIQVFLDEILD